MASFDRKFFALRYPEFADTNPDLLAAFFDEACLYVDNSAASVIPDAQRSLILHMATAHIAELSSTPLVGRIRSVNVSVTNTATQVDTQPGSQGWFEQTKYGYAAWEALSAFRCAFYIAPDR